MRSGGSAPPFRGTSLNPLPIHLKFTPSRAARLRASCGRKFTDGPRASSIRSAPRTDLASLLRVFADAGRLFEHEVFDVAASQCPDEIQPDIHCRARLRCRRSARGRRFLENGCRCPRLFGDAAQHHARRSGPASAAISRPARRAAIMPQRCRKSEPPRPFAQLLARDAVCRDCSHRTIGDEIQAEWCPSYDVALGGAPPTGLFNGLRVEPNPSRLPIPRNAPTS